MAATLTQADAVRLYLTGAASDGGAQTDPLESLGKYRSATEVAGMEVAVSQSIANITIDYVSHENGTGTAYLVAVTVDTVAWRSPGGAQGTAVAIANGETKQVSASGALGEYARVTRTSTTALAGSAVMLLSDRFNAAIGQRDVSVVDADPSGFERAWCLCVKNVSTGTVQRLKVWLKAIGTIVAAKDAYTTGVITLMVQGGTLHDWDDAGFVKNTTTEEVMFYASRTADTLTIAAAGRDVYDETAGGEGVGMAGAQGATLVPIGGLRIAHEAPSAQPSGTFTDNTANDGEQLPGALSFVTPTSEDDADVLDIGTLTTGQIAGIWLAKYVLPGQEPTAGHFTQGVDASFEVLV